MTCSVKKMNTSHLLKLWRWGPQLEGLTLRGLLLGGLVAWVLS